MGVTKACWKSSPTGEPKIDLSNKKFKEIEGKMCAKCTYLEFLVLPKNQINENWRPKCWVLTWSNHGGCHAW